MRTPRLRPLATLLACAASVSAPALAQVADDADADGVPDALDEYPCDPSLASSVYLPGANAWGMLMFEDLWPSAGDFDFNDAVIGHNTKIALAAMPSEDSEILEFGAVRIDMRLSVVALGASADNGLALRLPIDLRSITGAELSIESGLPVELEAINDGGETILVVSPALRELFGVSGFINTDPEGTTAPPVNLLVSVELDGAVALDTSLAPFDLFIFDAERGSEVHRPAYAGTGLMDPSLPGTLDDGSSPTRHFVTRNGIPFALNFPHRVPYAPERVAIDTIYPDIVEFGRSNGASHVDFYEVPVGTPFPLPDLPALPELPSADIACLVDCGPGAQGGPTDTVPPAEDLCLYFPPSEVTIGATDFFWNCGDVACVRERTITGGECSSYSGGPATSNPPSSQQMCAAGTPSELIIDDLSFRWTCGTDECARDRISGCGAEADGPPVDYRPWRNLCADGSTPSVWRRQAYYEWTCYQSGIRYVCRRDREGQCGFGSSGVDTPTPPEAYELCSVGQASEVLADGNRWTWTCGETACERGRVVPTGACGPADRLQGVLSAPSTDLCDDGVASAVTDQGWEFTWSCGNVPCAVDRVEVVCGSASGGDPVVEAPSTDLCEGNLAYLEGDPWVYVSEDGTEFRWNCDVMSCARARQVCGPAAGQATYVAPTAFLCNAGEASPVTASATEYSWSCDQNACTAPRLDRGPCGIAVGYDLYHAPPSNTLCDQGAASAVTITSDRYAWTCGSTQCSTNRLAPAVCGTGTGPGLAMGSSVDVAARCAGGVDRQYYDGCYRENRRDLTPAISRWEADWMCEAELPAVGRGREFVDPESWLSSPLYDPALFNAEHGLEESCEGVECMVSAFCYAFSEPGWEPDFPPINNPPFPLNEDRSGPAPSAMASAYECPPGTTMTDPSFVFVALQDGRSLPMTRYYCEQQYNSCERARVLYSQQGELPGYNTRGWVYEDWSACQASAQNNQWPTTHCQCGGGTQQRICEGSRSRGARCLDANGSLLAASVCEAEFGPALTAESCNPGNCTGGSRTCPSDTQQWEGIPNGEGLRMCNLQTKSWNSYYSDYRCNPDYTTLPCWDPADPGRHGGCYWEFYIHHPETRFNAAWWSCPQQVYP